MSILTIETGNDGTLTYDDFLKEKVAFDRKFGFDVDDSEISDVLLPHQKAIVKWAVRGDQGAMTTPALEYMRTLTTTAQQSIMRRPGEATAADLRAARDMLPDVLFRMFEPHEVAAGMAFPADYKWQPVDRLKPVSKRDLVKAAGNAVTPPAARDLVGAVVEALGQEVAA